MSTDLKKNELIINEMTKEQLDTLVENNEVPANQLFFTDEVDSTSRGLPIGTIIPLAVVSDDPCLQRLDGRNLLIDGIYSPFCNWLIERANKDITNVPLCTIEEYKLNLEKYGQCGKFVINETSEDIVFDDCLVRANSIK